MAEKVGVQMKTTQITWKQHICIEVSNFTTEHAAKAQSTYFVYRSTYPVTAAPSTCMIFGFAFTFLHGFASNLLQKSQLITETEVATKLGRPRQKLGTIAYVTQWHVVSQCMRACIGCRQAKNRSLNGLAWLGGHVLVHYMWFWKATRF